MRIAPSCRLIASEYSLLRIWQANQAGQDGALPVPLDAGPDHLRIRLEPDGIALERIGAGEFAWLAALSRRATLAAAIEDARRVDAAFDLGAALHRFIGDGTIAGVADGR